MILQKRMEIASKAEWFLCANTVHNFNTVSCLFYPETVSGQYFPITFCVQIGKAAAEFYLFAIHRNRTVS